MNKPQSFIIENENVYIALDIYNYDTAFFIGVCGRIRLIVEKLKLKETDYCWGYIKNNIWIKSTSKYPKAKLLLNEEYVINNIPKMMDKVKQELYKYEEAPPMFELNNNEKFKDKDNKIINIEIRGERESSKCYFKVKDVSVGFDMPSLQNIIIKENTNYELNLHYKFFIINKKNNITILSSKKYLYLTYKGMLKVLFNSRTSNAEAFQSWATEKLFTIQLGSIIDKENLSSSLLGIDVSTIKKVFNLNTSKTPVVYLIFIGNPNELLNDNKYSNDDILCKFGCTDDLDRRIKEHDKFFKKEFNKNIELLCFSIIEHKFIFNAESNIKQFFSCNKIQYKNTSELIVINKKNISQIKDHYKMIQNSYIGCYQEINNKIVELQKEIIQLNNTILLNNEINKNLLNNEINKNLLFLKDIELKDKDIQILQYQIKFIELSK
jgi:hypothetical protein